MTEQIRQIKGTNFLESEVDWNLVDDCAALYDENEDVFLSLGIVRTAEISEEDYPNVQHTDVYHYHGDTQIILEANYSSQEATVRVYAPQGVNSAAENRYNSFISLIELIKNKNGRR